MTQKNDTETHTNGPFLEVTEHGVHGGNGVKPQTGGAQGGSDGSFLVVTEHGVHGGNGVKPQTGGAQGGNGVKPNN